MIDNIVFYIDMACFSVFVTMFFTYCFSQLYALIKK